MDFDLDFVNPEEECLDENCLPDETSADRINQPHCREKFNKCNQCDYASSQAGHLRRHLKTHSGEKSHKCIECDYKSSRADNLRTHLKTHSGDKPNRCSQCDYASSRADKLRKHKQNHITAS